MRYQKKADFVLFTRKGTDIKQDKNVAEMNTKMTMVKFFFIKFNLLDCKPIAFFSG